MDLIKPNFLKSFMVSKEEAVEAAILLAPWHLTIKLSADFTEDELKKYIIVEMNSRRRNFVLSRLITRLGMLEKAARYADAQQAMLKVTADTITPLIKKAGKLPELKSKQ